MSASDFAHSSKQNLTRNEADRAILALAATHGWHVTRVELQSLGITRNQINHRIRRGFLIPVYAGVYAVGHLPTVPRDFAHGALLAAGPGAALCGPSAAYFWQITPTWSQQIHVAITAHRRPRGLIVHRITNLLPVDTRILEGPNLRLTSRARTLLDVAPGLTQKQLTKKVNDQRFDHNLSLLALNDVVMRCPRHPGATPLKRVIEQAPDQPYRSPWEMEWPEYADRYNIPDYDMNVPLARGVIADVVIRPRVVIIELDGWGLHGLRTSFTKDRRRDRDVYAELGIPTFRITRDDVKNEPAQTARTLLRIIARRRAELGIC